MLNNELAKIHSFKVVPSLPKPLSPLLDIAHNLWWTWQSEAVELFVRLDRALWQKYKHNPVRMLGNCPQQRLNEVARDEGYLTLMRRVVADMNRHVERTPWLQRVQESHDDLTIAYFCAEFGLSECLQIYSGGLGCLAGDHIKSASELGLPLVGVGLLYRHGYFQQYLNADGWQQEYYPVLDFANLPLERVQDDAGEQMKVSVRMPDRDVHIGIWKVRVGRIDVYLLDTSLSENAPADRQITAQLYGGDMETRIKQEIVLGIGGMRALTKLGIKPSVCHMNEGHSAFLALERIRKLIEQHDVSFDQARQYAAAGHVFTTHTPVPAGIDRFPPEMINRYFKDYHHALRLDMEGLLALGRENVFVKNEFFSMAVLAIRTSDWANGVSKLHGVVSRSMWQNIWPGVPASEIPIGHVTNGVHARSWLSSELTYMFDRHMGSRWQDNPEDQTVWKLINDVPSEELWRAHERRRHRLIVWTRRCLRRQLEARGTSPQQAKGLVEALDPRALTIGFARRFATYKRGTLLLRNPERLKRMLNSADRPVQFLIAGKAHPADGGGKELIKHIVQFARDQGLGHRIVFVENYDINVARYLVQGCDVWLNTPRRGMEASGTSGMKAALNGVLNCSILDGWWDEAYQSDLGWAIGRGETYANPDSQDEVESQALYDLLEHQIIPLFYERDGHGIPQGWVTKMKRCIAVLAPMFNTNRMVQDYAEKFYLPSYKRGLALGSNGLERAKALSSKKQRLREAWGRLRVDEVKADTTAVLRVHETLAVTADVFLADLAPDEVRVQVYAGMLDADGRITGAAATQLSLDQDLGQGRYRFGGAISTGTSGRHGFAVRIVPGGEMINGIIEPGLIYWDHVDRPALEEPPLVEATTA